jgi:phosphate transport system substrate-binding protein
MTKRLFAASLAVLAALAAIAATTAGASSEADQLVGAGSTFVAPLVSQWQKDYPAKTGVNIAYQPIGSGGGIASITARTVDFAGSDAPLSRDQFSACKGCAQIPWALGGTAIMVNVKTNAHAPLRITGPVLAGIYLGTIKTWNAPAI